VESNPILSTNRPSHDRVNPMAVRGEKRRAVEEESPRSTALIRPSGAQGIREARTASAMTTLPPEESAESSVTEPPPELNDHDPRFTQVRLF
jgi:hypothetical protein